MAKITIRGIEIYSAPFPESINTDTTIPINVSLDDNMYSQRWFPISEVGGFVSIEGLFVSIEFIHGLLKVMCEYQNRTRMSNICVFCRQGRNRSVLVIACLDLLEALKRGEATNFGMRGIYSANSVNFARLKALEDVLLQFTDRPFKACEAVEMYYDLIGK